MDNTCVDKVRQLPHLRDKVRGEEGGGAEANEEPGDEDIGTGGTDGTGVT